MQERHAIQAGQVRLRHIKLGLSTDPGAVNVLGKWYTPQPWDGVNGAQGFQSGDYEGGLGEDGKFSLLFPNAAGEDGVRHMDRFMCTSDPTYQMGDEWIEVYRGQGAGLAGELLFVGTPGRAKPSGSRIELSGVDAWWLLNLVRGTSAEFWPGSAPRDVFEHACGVWQAQRATTFTTETWSGSTTVSDDGTWRQRRATLLPGGGGVRLTPVTGTGNSAHIQHAAAGAVVTGPTKHWRFECSFIVRGGTNTWQLRMGLFDLIATGSTPVDGSGYASFQFNNEKACSIQSDWIAPDRTVGAAELGASVNSLAIEGRGRWLFFYVNGAMVGVQPQIDVDTTQYPLITLIYTSGGPQLDVLDWVVREHKQWLLRGTDKGDAVLPGQLTSGGLRGLYFDDHDEELTVAGSKRLLHPLKEPYATRLDAVIDFSGTLPATWQPVGPARGERFSVRWIGAIYLKAVQYAFTLTANQGGRLYIGDLRWGSEKINAWAANGAATAVNWTPPDEGWYPIRVEHWIGAAPDSAVCNLEFQPTGSNYTDPGGTIITSGFIQIVPRTSLSPQGVIESQQRYDSHFEYLQTVMSSYGLQAVCSPRQLESGEFPGQIIPRVREGRDTEYVLAPADSANTESEINAEEALSSLFVDAQGISDKQEKTTVVREAINHTEATRHLFVASGYENLSEISRPEMAEARAREMLALRTGPWQTISARPVGAEQLLDSFPLTGALSLFGWKPGDGLRLNYPDLGVVDLSPRQTRRVKWSFRPSGRGRPEVGFRQRPRNLRRTLRDIHRQALNQARNYQGQLVVVSGTVGSRPVNAFTTDSSSRVALPTNLDDIVTATLVVHYKSDTSTETVRVNTAVTGVTVVGAGRYDLTPHVARDTVSGVGTIGLTRMFVELISGTGSVEWSVELLVRV